METVIVTVRNASAGSPPQRRAATAQATTPVCGHSQCTAERTWTSASDLGSDRLTSPIMRDTSEDIRAAYRTPALAALSSADIWRKAIPTSAPAISNVSSAGATGTITFNMRERRVAVGH